MELFDRICETPEYYPFRAELSLLNGHAREMARELGRGCGLIELGSGASIKSRLLLDALEEPAWYAPVDVSLEALEATRRAFVRDYPNLLVSPVCADFMDLRELVATVPANCSHRGVFFPGSTIGNLEAAAAARFLEDLASLLHPDGALIVGVDLLKERSLIEAAYNDGGGVTAAFNLNVLHRLNRELGADFAPHTFRHQAYFNRAESRIEMHLMSLENQWVNVRGQRIHFRRYESIHTESSYKYAPDVFEGMASAAGFRITKSWTDERARFRVYALSV
jgi:dimethylhistidine N-methyltransferase